MLTSTDNMNSPPRKLLLFSFFYFFGFPIVPSTFAENLRFDFPSFTPRDLTFLGDSYTRNGVIGLTSEFGVPSSSSGSVISNYPVTFFDPNTDISASFWTRFSFSITNIYPRSYGDGLAFFLSPDNQTLGSSGGYLGLVDSSRLTKNKFIAIEFDTRLDSLFDDPNDNHIGLDIDSLTSVMTADPASRGIDLKSGNLITVWIDYNNDQKMLNVWMSYSSFKPERPILSVEIDLSKFFKEFMFVGFSASKEWSTEHHLIEEWTFQTFGYPLVKPQSQSCNVSDNSLIEIPEITVSDSSYKTYKKLTLGLGIGGPAFFCVVFMVIGWIFVKKWRETRTDESFRSELLKGPRQFSYRELKFATKGFHSNRILGHGAFGTVYKAIFPTSDATFVVKVSKHTNNGKTEFLAKLSIMACMRHRNLVLLQGWCAEKSELLLVYEFMPNGSLDKVLYQEPKEGIWLQWSQRYNIAVGIASVLAYLHQECEQQVIHRDIKTSNIMLDRDFNPRLGGFGLARLMKDDNSPVSTLPAEAMGYLAPEYLLYGKATEKTDVFSFGVVMLEVACGKRPVDEETNSEKIFNLVDWVWGLHSEGHLVEAADKRLNGKFKEEEMMKLLLVGLSCVNPACTERPSMRRVLQILNDEAELLVVPKMKPSLTFSYSLSSSQEDIVYECDKCWTPSPLNVIRKAKEIFQKKACELTTTNSEEQEVTQGCEQYTLDFPSQGAHLC